MIEVIAMSGNKFLLTDDEIQRGSHEKCNKKKNHQEFQNLMEHSKKTL